MQEVTKYTRRSCKKQSNPKPIIRLTLIRRQCSNASEKTTKRPPVTEWYIS